MLTGLSYFRDIHEMDMDDFQTIWINGLVDHKFGVPDGYSFRIFCQALFDADFEHITIRDVRNDERDEREDAQEPLVWSREEYDVYEARGKKLLELFQTKDDAWFHRLYNMIMGDDSSDSDYEFDCLIQCYEEYGNHAYYLSQYMNFDKATDFLYNISTPEERKLIMDLLQVFSNRTRKVLHDFEYFLWDASVTLESLVNDTHDKPTKIIECTIVPTRDVLARASGSNDVLARASGSNEVIHEVCGICQCEFVEDDVVCQTTCKHLFHEDCKDLLVTHRQNENPLYSFVPCPLCRAELPLFPRQEE